MTTPSSDPDPRRAWRQWVKASDQWHQRVHKFFQEQTHESIPLPDSWLALAEALQVQRAAERARNEAKQALLAQAPPFPEVCRGMTCGARTRQGTPCQRRDLYGPNARCRLHGGLSTGPKTAAGKQRSALNGLQPKRKRTPRSSRILRYFLVCEMRHTMPVTTGLSLS